MFHFGDGASSTEKFHLDDKAGDPYTGKNGSLPSKHHEGNISLLHFSSRPSLLSLWFPGKFSLCDPSWSPTHNPPALGFSSTEVTDLYCCAHISISNFRQFQYPLHTNCMSVPLCVKVKVISSPYANRVSARAVPPSHVRMWVVSLVRRMRSQRYILG